MLGVGCPGGNGRGQAIHQLGREPVPGRGGELSLPPLELLQQPILGVGQLGQRGRKVGLRRLTPLGGCLARSVPRHDRAGDEIAQSLSPGVERDQHGAEEVGRGKEIRDAEEISDSGRSGRDRVARVHQHPDTDEALAGRLAAAPALEEEEVPRPHRETAEQQDRGAPGAEAETEPDQNAECDEHAEHAADQNQHVEDGREGAGAYPGDLEIEDHVLGCLDLEMLAILARGHGAIVIRPTGTRILQGPDTSFARLTCAHRPRSCDEPSGPPPPLSG